jgi:hypothetical protein
VQNTTISDNLGVSPSGLHNQASDVSPTSTPADLEGVGDAHEIDRSAPVTLIYGAETPPHTSTVRACWLSASPRVDGCLTRPLCHYAL